MPNFAKTHEDARKVCCAGCGIHTAEKDRKLPLTKLLEKLIKKLAHPSFDSTVASFPVGLCATCRRMLYKCEKCEKEGKEVRPREVWSGFILEEIKVPRMSVECSVCSCPLCKCARYNPIGIVGPKEETHKSVINVSGGNMKCEIQPKVKEKVQVTCLICGQIKGPGIKHGCTRAEQRLASLARMPRSRSAQRTVLTRKTRALSVLVGQESLRAQEQIASAALARIKVRKGANFRLLQAKGGGTGGLGAKVNLEDKKDKHTVLPIEVFKEIKKNLIKSRRKNCAIMSNPPPSQG